MRREFIDAIRANEKEFGVELADGTVERLADYYELVQQHNPLLHLVAPCSPEEFATRHILESLTVLRHLPNGAHFVDVGTGAGLPSIPCLIARTDLRATLIESKEKKVKFLREAVDACKIADRAEIVNSQFSETSPGGARYVTCRALDKFVEKLPQLLKWAGSRELLLYGGPGLRSALEKSRREFREELMPFSEKRFLFRVRTPRPSTGGHARSRR
jgi:16S rRNA (guanine527-N7)-methyltransferase